MSSGSRERVEVRGRVAIEELKLVVAAEVLQLLPPGEAMVALRSAGGRERLVESRIAAKRRSFGGKSWVW